MRSEAQCRREPRRNALARALAMVKLTPASDAKSVRAGRAPARRVTSGFVSCKPLLYQPKPFPGTALAASRLRTFPEETRTTLLLPQETHLVLRSPTPTELRCTDPDQDQRRM